MPIQGSPQGATFMAIPPASSTEEFFMRFGGAVHAGGHTLTERLVPPGFPVLPFQPVYRFRSSQAGSAAVAFFRWVRGCFPPMLFLHMNPGLHFVPVVQEGVRALLETRSRNEMEKPITLASLRYIDAFQAVHTEGRDISRFLSEIFGISVTIPKALSQHLRPESVAKPIIQLQIPMTNGAMMTLGIGEGMANAQPAILMDTCVSSSFDIPSNLDGIMQTLDSAHNAIDKSFFRIDQADRAFNAA